MKVIISIFIIFCTLSCSYKPISKEVKGYFTNRFEGKKTGIEKLLSIDGYYQSWEEKGIDYKTGKRDTFFLNVLFYNDGTLLYNFFKPHDYEGNTDMYLKQVAKKWKEDPYYVAFDWGSYILSNDTIKAQYISNAHHAYLAPWDAEEQWFKIIDKKTIKPIYFRLLDKMNDDQVKDFKNKVEASKELIFQQVDTIPPPYCWLKEEKWLWRNEEDWKKYMEQVK